MRRRRQRSIFQFLFITWTVYLKARPHHHDWTELNWQHVIIVNMFRIVQFSSVAAMWIDLKLSRQCYTYVTRNIAFSLCRSWASYHDRCTKLCMYRIKSGSCRKCSSGWHTICLRYSYRSWQDFNWQSVARFLDDSWALLTPPLSL